MGAGMNESTLEQAALDWFRELGYEYVHGARIAPDLPALWARHGQAVKPRRLPVRCTRTGETTTSQVDS